MAVLDVRSTSSTAMLFSPWTELRLANRRQTRGIAAPGG